MNLFKSSKKNKSRPPSRITIGGPEPDRAAAIDSNKAINRGALENGSPNIGPTGTVPNTIVIGIDFGTTFTGMPPLDASNLILQDVRLPIPPK
jgi:hypothetical protein